MNKTIPQIVSLVPEEKKLLNKITFGFGHGDNKIIRESCAGASPLASSLLARNVIPEIHIRYFTDPELNVGTKKSREQVLGITGDAICSNPRFLEYLYYFIYGPNLPAQVITKFSNTAYPYEYISGGDTKDLRKLAISLVDEYKLNPRDVACEFFKLAIEYGMDVYMHNQSGMQFAPYKTVGNQSLQTGF
jgi:hypothetical protein